MPDEEYLFLIIILLAILFVLYDKFFGKDDPDQGYTRQIDATPDFHATTAHPPVRRGARQVPPRQQSGPVAAPDPDVRRERDELLGRAVPPDVQRDMAAFLRAGRFHGEDHSPLAYVGYKVGRTNGLPTWDRQRRLKICFRTKTPRQLMPRYEEWGQPASYQRFVSMNQHLRMLADMRRYRPNYEDAVAEWEQDAAWFRQEFEAWAERLRRGGFER